MTGSAVQSPSREGGYRVVRYFVGLLLLVAASLKAYELLTQPVLGEGILQSRFFLAAVVEFELFLGFWLLAGVYPRLGRLVAVLGELRAELPDLQVDCGD